MSKFTKALEKIQEDRSRQKETSPAPNVKTAALYEVAGQTKELKPGWDRAVPVQKNLIPDVRVVTQRFPNSFVSEQYRMLRTSLKTNLQKENAKVILISSSIHGEGKTVTAANLAIALAENGDAKVVVLDADLRRGKLAEYLGFGKKHPGLAKLLANGLAPKQVIVRNSLENLAVIPCGPFPKNPSELVSSSKFQLLISELRNHFDYILIDSPPIMPAADAGILGRVADGVLMVIQVGRTPKSVISHANMLFKQAGVKMLGYILTNVEFQSSDYRYYNRYYEEQAAGQKNLKERMTDRAVYQLRLAGQNLRDMETRFNDWWEKSVLKKKRKAYRKDQ